MQWPTLFAGYAAGVSTLVAARQIAAEFPSVRVTVSWGARLLPQDTEITIVDVTNAGRRPVIINMVGYLAPEYFLGIPGTFPDQMHFRLQEGEAHSLRFDPALETVPRDAIFVARDTLGRWWPRQRRPQIRLRAWRTKRKGRSPGEES